MGCGRWMGNRGFHITQVCRNRYHSGCIDKAPGFFTTAPEAKRQHPTKAFLLLFCKRVLRMAFKPCVIHSLHFRLLLQPRRQL